MIDQQVFRIHHQNQSKTHEAFRFSKAPRFPKTNRVSTEQIYNLPSTKDKKATSFGYGTKSTFNCNKISVAPGTYNAQSDFQKKEFNNTPSIYIGREKCLFGSFLLEALKRNRYIPSPDKYNVKDLKTVIGGNIGQRIKTEPNEKQNRNITGPGAYNMNATEIGQKGNYILSNFKNTSSPRYHSVNYSLTRDRLSKKAAHKHSITSIHSNAQAIQNENSKFNHRRAISFSKAKRLGIEAKYKLHIPGFKSKRFSENNVIS